MRPSSEFLRQGAYAKKQLFSGFLPLRWSHGSRFELAARLVREYSPDGTVLDYGCGDGTFLALLADPIGN